MQWVKLGNSNARMFCCCLLHDTSSRNTPPPRDPSGGIVYLGIVLSPEEASHLVSISEHGFSRGGVFSASPNPQAGGPPLVGCPRLLIQFIRSYPSYRRLILHLQPEDAPCCGDRDPLIAWDLYSIRNVSRMTEVISLLVFDEMSPRASVSLLLPLLCECCNWCDQIMSILTSLYEWLY